MAIYADKKDGKPTGRWRVEVQKGSSRLRGRYDTHPEAVKAETDFKARLEAGDAPEAKRRFDPNASKPLTLQEAFEKAEGKLWSGKKSEETSVTRLKGAIRHLGPNLPIDALKTTDVDDMIDSLKADGLSDATVNRYLSSVSKFLKWCVERDYRTEKLPTFAWRDEDEGRIRWITDEEEPELLSSLRSEAISKLVKAAIITGMRRGELLSLELQQVTPNWVHLWETKSGEPRSVPVNEETFADLRWLIVKGLMPNPSQLRYEWDLARKAMGLTDDPWFVFHACRHTCATRYVQAKENLRVIQKLMGHKRIETTLRYSHVNEEMLTDALQGLMAHRSERVASHLDMVQA